MRARSSGSCSLSAPTSKHRISGFGQRVRPTEALGCQGTASWPVPGLVPYLTPLSSLLFSSVISVSVPCEVSLSPCLSTLLAAENAHVWPLPPPAARPSRRACRPKPRHAKVGAAMPAELGQHALGGGVKRNKERNVNQSGDTRFGLGQLLRARIRPMAGDSPSGYSLTGQSGLVFARTGCGLIYLQGWVCG